MSTLLMSMYVAILAKAWNFLRALQHFNLHGDQNLVIINLLLTNI